MHQDVYNEISRARAPRTGPSAPMGSRAPTRPAAGRSSTAPGRPASPSATSGQQRRGRPAGPVRPGLGRRGARLRRRPLGRSATTPSTSRSPPRSSLRRRALRRRARVLLHGTAHIGRALHGAPPCDARRTTPPKASCRPSRRTTPVASVFDEPDNSPAVATPTYLGPMDLPNLVFNVHVYCGARSPVTGNPTTSTGLRRAGAHSLGVRAADRPEMASPPSRADRPGWSPSSGRPARRRCSGPSRRRSTPRQVGWIYWSWKYYGDPTGSAAESLVMADGHLRSTAEVLSRAYPEAVAGTPLQFSYSPQTDVFTWRTCPTTACMRRRSSSCRRRCTTGTATAPARRAHG